MMRVGYVWVESCDELPVRDLTATRFAVRCATSFDGVLRGLHEVQVKVTDGKGGTATAILSVRTVDASACDKPPPPCPVITVSIP